MKLQLTKEQWYKLIKKNFPYILMIMIIIALMLFGGISQRNISVWKKQVDLKEQEFQKLKKVRDSLEYENFKLNILIKLADRQIDSLILLKKDLQKQMTDQATQFKKEIDSLLNVPNDTIFGRLQPIYPNLDLSPLLYPFSGSQIRQIYSTALSYPRLMEQYRTQETMLNLSDELNTKYQLSLRNYASKIENLNANLLACDNQIQIREEHLAIREKQLRNKTVWNWIFKGTTIIFATYSAIK
jgi:exonuclease VII large subunit